MFSSLSKPNYPRAALGLEEESITALVLQKEGRGRFGIRQASSVELPSGLLVPNFIEKNISNYDEYFYFLDQALTDSGLMKNKRWSVSLPANTARTAILTLEDTPASKKELEEVLDWKAETSFGVASAELRLSQEKISPNIDGKTRYFATAIKLSVIDEFETIFESYGWKAGLILPRAISESKWLTSGNNDDFSLLISSQKDGFTALLLNGSEPAVVRSVTCDDKEIDDEIYRLLIYYQDRFASDSETNLLNKFLVVGKEFVSERIREITAEALGEPIDTLSPDELGLDLPVSNIEFDKLAAPAGVARLAW